MVHQSKNLVIATFAIISAFSTQLEVRRFSDRSGLSPDPGVQAFGAAIGPSFRIYKILQELQELQGTHEALSKPHEIRETLAEAIKNNSLNGKLCDNLHSMSEFLQRALKDPSVCIHTTEKTPTQVKMILDELEEHYYVYTATDVLKGHSIVQCVPRTLGATTQLVLPDTQGVAAIATLTGNIITVTLHLHHRSANPAMLDTLLSQIRSLPEARGATHVVFGGDMNFGVPSTTHNNVPNLTGDNLNGVYLTSIGTQLLFVSSGQVNTGNPFRGWDIHPFAIALLHPCPYTLSVGCMIRKTGTPMKTMIELLEESMPESQTITAQQACDPTYFTPYADAYNKLIIKRGSDHTRIVQLNATVMVGLGPLTKNTEKLSQMVTNGLCGSAAASSQLPPAGDLAVPVPLRRAPPSSQQPAMQKRE